MRNILINWCMNMMQQRNDKLPGGPTARWFNAQIKKIPITSNNSSLYASQWDRIQPITRRSDHVHLQHLSNHVPSHILNSWVNLRNIKKCAKDHTHTRRVIMCVWEGTFNKKLSSYIYSLVAVKKYICSSTRPLYTILYFNCTTLQREILHFFTSLHL